MARLERATLRCRRHVHAGGRLNEALLGGDVVTCPWHGSRFCARNGRVLGGPVTFDQPSVEVHEEADVVRLDVAR